MPPGKAGGSCTSIAPNVRVGGAAVAVLSGVSRRAPANGTFCRKALHVLREFQSQPVLLRVVMALWADSQYTEVNVWWTKSTQNGFWLELVTMAPAGGSPRVPRRS